MNEEFLELFGDVSAYTKVVDRLVGECTHENFVNVDESDPTRGYCRNCGHVSECKHLNFIEENLIKICRDCGKELKELDMTSEWRCYNSNNSSSRCHKSKKTRSIDDILGNKDIPESIRDIVEERFQKITSNINANGTKATLRSSKRISLIATCLFYTYIEKGQFYTIEHFTKMFNITQHDIGEGKSEYLKVYKNARTLMIKPSDLLKWLMNKARIPSMYYTEILKLSNIIKPTTNNLKRAKPQAIAASIIYTWLCTKQDLYNELNMSKPVYSSLMDISPATLITLVTDIKNILVTPEIC